MWAVNISTMFITTKPFHEKASQVRSYTPASFLNNTFSRIGKVVDGKPIGNSGTCKTI